MLAGSPQDKAPQQPELANLATVNATLTAKGLLLKSGALVDATLIAAPDPTKKQQRRA